MIEDIDYLIENKDLDSQVIFIDSSTRNKRFYPNSNNYAITFDQPFNLVYGFEILNAAVPVTMYNIDIYNNTFYYSVVYINSATLVNINPVEYVNEIITSKSFISLFNNEKYQTFIIVGSTTQLNNFISLATPYNYIISHETYLMYIRQTINTFEIIPLSTQNKSEYFFFIFKSINYCIKQNLDNQNLIDIINTNEYSLTLNNDSSITLIYFIPYNINKNTYIAIKNSNSFIIAIENKIATLSIGNYTLLTITNALNDIINPDVSIATTTFVPNQEGKIYFYSSSYIMINASIGNMVNSLGFDTYPFGTESLTTYSGLIIGDNYLVYGSVYDQTIPGYKIISPGLVSLLGERFAILEIEELNDHLAGSYSYTSGSVGVAMFTMAAAFGGMNNLRFDFTTLIRKPFHPIGKLSKLTLSFKTIAGNLYDFKCINHQLMINIKFYRPTQKNKFIRSILNPNYDPNVMNYLSNKRNIQNEEDSDEEQIFDNDKYYELYKKELDKYDYSSSDDDNESVNNKSIASSDNNLSLSSSNNNDSDSDDSEINLDTYIQNIKKFKLGIL